MSGVHAASEPDVPQVPGRSGRLPRVSMPQQRDESEQPEHEQDAVLLGPGPAAPWVRDVARRLSGADVEDALAVAAGLTGTVPLPGSGETLQRWELLASVAAVNLTAARVLEAHLDAVAILAEAREGEAVPATATWGVFAAEAPGTSLVAREGADGRWELQGDKPWCSLASRLTHALVTAHVPDGRRLFAVELRQPGVSVLPDAWHARGLVDVPSGPVRFGGALARPVGATGWYLRRPGFAHGGLGVAACWYGGAVGLARAVARAARRRSPDQLALCHLGALDLDLSVARAALAGAAADVDGGRADGAAGELLALRVRSVVASCAERVLQRTGHALGPAPLTLDADHAARAADLTVYLRQHHAERDVARLGGLLVAQESLPW